MKARTTAVTALALAGLALGCGSSDDKAAEAEHSTTPQQAIAEIGKVRSGLAQALATYEAGDVSAADRQVGDTYLQHFELVEGPLGQADHKLNEQLEDTIREQLRARIRADAGAAKVRALVRAIDAKLDAAERALAHQ